MGSVVQDEHQSRAVSLEIGGESLDVISASVVKLDLAAETDRDKRKVRIDLSLSWRATEEAPTPAQLRIAARTPSPIPQLYAENGKSREST